jgi:hypothetical protein
MLGLIRLCWMAAVDGIGDQRTAGETASSGGSLKRSDRLGHCATASNDDHRAGD